MHQIRFQLKLRRSLTGPDLLDEFQGVRLLREGMVGEEQVKRGKGR